MTTARTLAPGILAAGAVMGTGFQAADGLGHLLLEFQGGPAQHFL